MDAYRQITQGVAAGLNNSVGSYWDNFKKLDPQKFNEMKRREEAQFRMEVAEQMHTARSVATAQNVDRVAAKKKTVRVTHDERIKKRIQTQVGLPESEKRKPGRPKKLPPVASGPPVHTASPSPS